MATSVQLESKEDEEKYKQQAKEAFLKDNRTSSRAENLIESINSYRKSLHAQDPEFIEKWLLKYPRYLEVLFTRPLSCIAEYD